MNLNEHKVLGDQRGKLVVIESEKQVPFDIKRVFYIYGTQSKMPRGNHAHFQTKQYLISVSGSCKVTLDNGKTKKTYDLDAPNKGLFQDALVWGTMYDFSEDNVLLVFADDSYKAEDYITDYDFFLKVVDGQL